VHGETPERQRVGHFVRQDHSAQRRLRQCIQPPDSRLQLGRQAAQAGTLPIPQIRADLKNQIMRRQRFQIGQARQQNLGECAAPRAQLKQHPVSAQQRRALAGDARAEER
jgi:hypothetical protein